MNKILRGPLCGLVLCLPCVAVAADAASGSFRLGEQTIEPRHAIAVQAESGITSGASETWVYLSVSPCDAAPVAAAFDRDCDARAGAG